MNNLFLFVFLTASLAVGLWIINWFVRDLLAERAHRRRKRMITIYPSPFMAHWAHRDRPARPNARRML